MKDNSYVEECEELGYVNVLTIHLVAKEKYQKRNDKTPRRKKVAAAYSSSGGNDNNNNSKILVYDYLLGEFNLLSIRGAATLS